MRSAIVTGASSGIGAATATALAARGWAVALVARRRERLAEVAARIREAGGRAHVAPHDVADVDGAAAVVAGAEEAHGPTDLLVANAGMPGGGTLLDLDLARIERVMRVNYLGAVAYIKAALPGMLERGRGHIVAVASVAGRIGVPSAAPYTASKFALAGLTEALAAEVRDAGVRVTLVNPGPVRTESFPHPELAGRRILLEPPDVARAILRAIERGRAEVSVPRGLGALQAVRILAPPLYRAGLRTFRRTRFRPTSAP